ncbi:RHS repeat protein, partial [Thermoactinomyces mirandus]
QSTTYDYDLNGNQTKITYPNGNIVEFGYNAVDRQTSVKYNGTERYVFAYDPNGNLTQETDKSTNQTTSYEYDADNKVKTVQYHDGRTDYTYDKNGNVTRQKHTIGVLSYIHDYAYNSVNQLIQIKANSTNVAAFTYNENDQIASRKNNDGTLSLFAYNGAGDLVKQTIYDKYGNPIDSFSYTYDTKGNITSITPKSGTTTYEYDELDQLIKETAPDGTITEYTYDAAGNRTSKKVTSDGTTTTTTYTYDDADQLTAVNGQAYTYDENGNLTNDGSKTYAYDSENRLTRVQSGSETVQFAYRADGMRTSMTTSAGTTYFHYDENKNVSFETDASGQVVASYTFDGENRPVNMTKGGQTYYFQLNGQGDVIALTDANGNVVATYSYDAYGRITSQTGTVKSPYLYRGYRYDWETGLYYLQSRYYNPETGRFLTRDTFEGVEEKPISLN